jgi:hypothetical protein
MVEMCPFLQQIKLKILPELARRLLVMYLLLYGENYYSGPLFLVLVLILAYTGIYLPPKVYQIAFLFDLINQITFKVIIIHL